MSTVIPFPVKSTKKGSDIDTVIEETLISIPKGDREKIRFELVKTIDSYDPFFSEWVITIPEDSTEELKKQIYDIARQEHERKMMMLADIVRLKIKVLVDEYHRH